MGSRGIVPAYVELGQCAVECFLVVLLAAQRGQAHARRLTQAFEDRASQGRVRSQLDIVDDATTDHLLNGLSEDHGVAHVVPEVIGSQLWPRDETTQNGGIV